MKTKIAVIGGGPAGLAAAISAYDNGVKDVLILEVFIIKWRLIKSIWITIF